MKYGICTSIPAQWITAASYGYDYVEGNFSILATASEETFAAMLKAREQAGIDVETYNCFFPGSFRLYAYDPATGEETEDFAAIEAEIRRYVTLGMSRAARLGGKLVVIGSGRARNIAEDMPRALGVKQFSRHLTAIADLASEFGITVTVEPLNPSETNLINTLADSLAIARALNHPNIGVMIDFFHAYKQNEAYAESIEDAGEMLAHVHLCRSDRSLPFAGDAKGDLLPCLAPLRAIGYDRRVSLEGRVSPDFETAARVSIAELRVLFEG